MRWANPHSPNLPDFRLFVAQIMKIGPGYCPPALGAPATPSLAVSDNGALSGGTVYVATTYVSQSGKTIISQAATASVVGPSGSVAVNAPSPINNATGWNVYAGASL